MTSNNSIDAARVELLLSELRLPGVKLMWAKLAEQSDKEGLAGGPLPRGARRARDGRSQPPPHRAASRRGASACRQDAHHVRLRQRADGLEGPGDGARVGRCVAEQGRQYPAVRPTRRRQEPSLGRPRPRTWSRTVGACCSPAPPISCNGCRSRGESWRSKAPSPNSTATIC